MNTDEIQNTDNFVLIDTIDYVTNSIMSKTLIKKLTGTVKLVAVDTGQILTERVLPFDSFIQVIEGSAQVVMASRSVKVDVGQALIIPAHSRNSIEANVRFKMLSTVIKSGYEEVSVI
jgi:mannose-6-phosphate isomerase-like protein (cupin superfamily)